MLALCKCGDLSAWNVFIYLPETRYIHLLIMKLVTLPSFQYAALEFLYSEFHNMLLFVETGFIKLPH